jgi:beta-xylosidase
LAQGTTSVNGPHQGAWVETSAGDHWFIHFQELPVYGRVIHLQPLRWKEGWPEIGQTPGDHGPGEPILVGRKPLMAGIPRTGPATSDEFKKGTIGRQWQWQANPESHWTSPGAEAGSLLLKCVAHEPGQSLWTAPNLLMQKFPAPDFEVTTVFRFCPAHDGDLAGLIIFGHDYAWLGLRWRNGRWSLVMAQCLDAHQRGQEREIFSREVTSQTIHLRVTVKSGGLCQFAASDGGDSFETTGPEFQAASSDWVGAKVGLFATARERHNAPAGSVQVHGFRVTRPLPLFSSTPDARLTESR